MHHWRVKDGEIGVGRSAFKPYVLLDGEQAHPETLRIDQTRVVLTVSEALGLIEALQEQVAHIQRAPCGIQDEPKMVDHLDPKDLEPIFPPPAPCSYDPVMDVLYVKRKDTKVSHSVECSEEFTSDFVKNVNAEGDVVGVTFVGCAAHQDDWYGPSAITKLRKTLPRDIVAAVDNFYLSGEKGEILPVLGPPPSPEPSPVEDRIAREAELRRKSPSYEGGALVAWMVRPNPQAAKDEHERVKKLIEQQADESRLRVMRTRVEGTATELEECQGLLGLGSCKKLKPKGFPLCFSCQIEFNEDPDGYK